MKPAITFVYAYFENPTMFAEQQRIWAKYPPELQKRLEVIVTDDCSKLSPLTADMVRTDGEYNISVFRITNKIPWNWLEARNIGAHYAENPWLLLTDMDHVVSIKNFKKIMKRLSLLHSEMVYQFTRVLAPDNAPYHFHNDTFLVTRQLFWDAGGYDEYYAGNYGTSGLFRRRLLEHSQGSQRLPIDLTLYPRTVIADASTTSLPRKEGRDPQALSRITRWKNEQHKGIAHFMQPYERVI